MKKLIALLLTAALLTGCGETEKPGDGGSETVANESGTTEITEETPEVTEKMPNPEYAETVERDAERAAKLAKSTINFYIDNARYANNGGEVRLAEKYKRETGEKSGVASVWHYTSAMAMTSRVLAIGENDEYFARMYADMYKGLRYYSGTAEIITYRDASEAAMYAVNRASKPGAADITGVLAVYDDQMWIVRELLYAYKQRGEPEYLVECERLAGLCVDGWDFTENSSFAEFGGIPWGPGYSSKHTCSNAPLIAPLAELSELYAPIDTELSEYYLGWAKKIYAFCRVFENDSGRYGDLIGSERVLTTDKDGGRHYKTLKQGPGVDRSEYPYNSGAMIDGGAALYRVTGDEKYIENAKKSAAAAYAGFTERVNGGTQYVHDTTTLWFNLILLEGFIALAPYDDACEEYIGVFQSSLDTAYDEHNRSGLLPRSWLGGWDMSDGRDSEKNIMDQAAAAQTYALLSEYYRSLP